jgi:flagellar protein FlaG
MVMNVNNATTDTVVTGRGVPSSSSSAVSPLPKRQGVAADGQQQDQPATTSTANQVSETAMQAAVTRLNDYVQNVQRNLEFSVDKETGCTVVTVRDGETNEVIRQIPPEKMLAVMRALVERESGSAGLGLLVREKA